MVLLIFALAIVGGIYFVFKLGYIGKTSYAEQLWNRLDVGDVNSVDCQRAVGKYSVFNSVLDSDTFYNYQKKRGLGFVRENYFDENRNLTGSTDRIVDLINNDTLVSCTFYFDGNSDVVCWDNNQRWTADSKSKVLPPPFPLYSSVWTELLKWRSH